jgi:hypothetical protein
LERAIALTGRPSPRGLYSGSLGVAWAVEHLVRPGGRELDVTDRAVLQELTVTPDAHCDLDLISGVIGLGVYGLERAPGARASECLEAVLSRIESAARRNPPFSSYVPSDASGSAAQPLHGYLDLGLAHGLAGTIALLALLSRTPPLQARACSLLEIAVPLLLSFQNASEVPSFPYAIGGNGPEKPGRLAWCYGDPGMATALVLAGRLTQNSSWLDHGVAIACRAVPALKRRATLNEVMLCHGAAGIGHIYNRLYQCVGISELAEVATTMFDWIVADGTTCPGFLQGYYGAGLALVAAYSDREPCWDRLLLLS